MRLRASERLHGEEVNARATQLNIADGQEGGGGAVLPSHAMLSIVIVTRRTQAGAKETVACTLSWGCACQAHGRTIPRMRSETYGKN